MSVNEVQTNINEVQTGRNSRDHHGKNAPLLPEAGAGGAPLTAVIAVISFLAAMALAALLIINQTTSAWTASLKSEATIQIKGESAEAILAQTNAAEQYLNDSGAFSKVRIISDDEAAALLEPWLGNNNVAAFLTIPALIEVEINARAGADLSTVYAGLVDVAPGVIVDDHSRWHDRLSAAAQSMQSIAFLVFALVLAAACAVSIFAARAGLAANRDIVSILHLVGATDAFIAEEVQRRFFLLGLRGSLAGLLVAMVSLGAAAFTLRTSINASNFMPEFSLNATLMIALLTVPIIVCLATAITARHTVLRALIDEY